MSNIALPYGQETRKIVIRRRRRNTLWIAATILAFGLGAAFGKLSVPVPDRLSMACWPVSVAEQRDGLLPARLSPGLPSLLCMGERP